MQRVVAEQERRRPDPEYPAALVGWTQRPSRSRRASSAFMITLLELTVGSPAIRSPTGRLALTGLAGQQPLVGAAGQLVGAGLFSPLGATLLASLDAGLEGPAGDGGDPMLGRLGVLVPGGASDPGTEQLNLFTATGPTPHCLACDARAGLAKPGFSSRNAWTRSGRVPRVGTAAAHLFGGCWSEPARRSPRPDWSRVGRRGRPRALRSSWQIGQWRLAPP
jgi:hypothetical protein